MSGANMTELIVGAIVGTALWGAIGVGLGAIITNQVGAVIALLAWGFVVENLVFGFLPKIGRFLPVHASDAMMGPIQNKLLPGNAGVARHGGLGLGARHHWDVVTASARRQLGLATKRITAQLIAA